MKNLEKRALDVVDDCLIIAEAGVNHCGSLERAFQLIDVAAYARADVVKFQSFSAETLVTPHAGMAKYQTKRLKNENITQYQLLKDLELPLSSYAELARYCKLKNIEFLSTAFDLNMLYLLLENGMSKIKIPSGELTNTPFLREISTLKLPVFLSTGMSSLAEIRRAVDVLLSGALTKDLITILHCTSEYPAPVDEINLRAMPALGDEFGLNYGYSDHSEGISIPIAAAAMGATVLEKHFTLSRDWEGPDHQASLLPEELAAMVSGVREVVRALGSSEKRVTTSEMSNRTVVRRGMYASVPIHKGERLTFNNIILLRPCFGIGAEHCEIVLGMRSPRDYEVGEAIVWSDFDKEN